MDIEEIDQKILPLVKNCGKSLLGLGKQNVTFKENKSEVTKLDLKLEKELRENLKKIFPETGFIGEEFSNENQDKEKIWVIDPIDGTTYFAKDVPIYAVAVGRLNKGKSDLGIVHFPALNKTIVASAGRGVFLNGQRVKSAGGLKLEDTVVHLDRDEIQKLDGEEKEWTFSALRNLMIKCKKTRMFGSSSFGLLNIVSGSVHGFVHITGRCPIWDIVAQETIMIEFGLEKKLIDKFSPYKRIVFAPPEVSGDLVDLIVNNS